MKMKDIFALAATNIQHRHLRSWLTILGIVIGVASIISLISISLGLSDAINSRINTLGTNIITISPGGQQSSRLGGGFGAGAGPARATTGGGGGSGGFGVQTSQATLTFEEANVLRGLPGVYKLDARVSKRGEVQYKESNATLSIVGTEPSAFADDVGVNLTYGRYLSSSDQYSAVIGYNIANETFNDFSMLNKQIKIDGVPFHVVGILQQSGLGTSDSTVFIPQKTAQNLFNQTTDASQIVVVVSPDHDTDTVASEIENELITLHHVTTTTEDFTITTAATLQSTISSITDTLTLFLGGIASISLLVGGIGVANTMFMSVLEQTKDIGVFKSIGAKNKDIIYLFLCEAATIGFIGGALGVALSFVVSYILASLGIPSVMSLTLVAAGLIFSVLIGIIAGIAPARNAASIPPVEALKYE